MAIQVNTLAAKPQLMKVVLDTDDIKEKYGDSLEFYIYDRLQMSEFIKIAQMLESDYANAVEKLESHILDEKGKSVVQPGTVLPADVMSAAVTKIIEQLGK